MYSNFNLKSYFTFLSRNKIYTLINVFGLVVSLMFVVLIGLYVWQERSINNQNANADRILAVGLDFKGEGNKIVGAHHILQKQLRKMYPSVESSCGVSDYEVRLKNGDDYVRAHALLADSTFFRIFDYKLKEGDRQTCLDGKDDVVISESLARKLFGDQPAVGKNVVWRDSLRLKVTGVMQNLDHTMFNNDPEIVMNYYNMRYGNYTNTDESFDEGGINICGSAVFLLMQPGTTLIGQENAVNKALKASSWSFLESNQWNCDFFFIPLNKLYSSGLEQATALKTTNPTMVTILGAVGLVILLFSMMNYVNLTVALSGRRAREMAARRLFGSQKSGIVWRMIAESLILCGSAAVLAIVLAVVFAPTFGKIIGTDLNIRLLLTPAVAFGLVVGVVLLGAVSGMIPAAIASRIKPVDIFRGTFVHQTKMRFSRIFIVLQNIITITMLACATVMLLQMKHIVNAPLGFNKDGVLIISSVTGDAFTERMRQLPFVEAIAPSMGTPLDGGNNFTIVDKSFKRPVSFQILVVEKSFFDVYGLKLSNGDAPTPGHYYLNQQAIDDIHAYPNVLGTEKTVLQKIASEDLVSKSLQYGGQINDFRLRNIEEATHPTIVYVVERVGRPWQLSLKLTGNMADNYNKIAAVVREMFHEDLYDDDAMFADRYIQEVFEQKIRASHVMGLFAVIAIVISLLGLVAMSTYFIQQRNKEIAIRKVFGSTSNQVRRRLIRSFLLYVVVAFVVAVPLFWYFMGKWMSGFTYRIVWWPWIGVAGAAVLIVSYVSVAVQSYLAANENPVLHVKDNE